MQTFTIYAWRSETLVPIADIQAANAEKALADWREIIRSGQRAYVCLPAMSTAVDHAFNFKESNHVA